MDIVFNINPLGLEGLGATLASLVRNCPGHRELKLWFLCSGLHGNDRDNILRLLKTEKFDGLTEFIDFDAKAIFGHLRPLHGDWTGYGRLLAADYIDSDYALYLDADLIVNLDVLQLKPFDFGDAILAAVYSSSVSWALEKTFFLNELKLDSETAYFNSGVLLFNLKKWRSSNAEAQWREVAQKYPDELLAIDQTLLNAICKAILRGCHLPLIARGMLAATGRHFGQTIPSYILLVRQNPGISLVRSCTKAMEPGRATIPLTGKMNMVG